LLELFEKHPAILELYKGLKGEGNIDSHKTLQSYFKITNEPTITNIEIPSIIEEITIKFNCLDPSIKTMSADLDVNDRNKYNLMARCKYEEAETLINEELATGQSTLENTILLSRIFLKEGKIIDSRKMLNAAIKIDPLNPIALRKLGKLEEQNNNYSEAIKYFEPVINIDPDAVLPDLAYCYYKTGDNEMAKKYSRYVLRSIIS
jgi:tetratricopeptide (TPR) repeat protein